MTLQYKVKAGRLTNLTDARFFNAQGVDWLGFNMDVLDDHCISLKDLKEIRQWLFEPKIVLECGTHQDRTEMIYLANEVYAEAVEVPLEHPLLEDDHFAYPVFVSLLFDDLQRTRTRKRLRDFKGIEALVLRTGAGEFDWEDFRGKAKGKRNAIRQLKAHCSVLVELPFQPEWLMEAIELLEPSGIQIPGGKEEKPGMSSVDEYDALLSLLEVEQ